MSGDYFESIPDHASIMKQLIEGKAGSTPSSEPALRTDATAWAERGVFRLLLERFKVLPITTDSHIGEYIQWAHDVADIEGILNFYRYYKQWTLNHEPEIKEVRSERLVKILEGMILDTSYEESAVNIPNKGCIVGLPDWIVVEVPAIVNSKGIAGLTMKEIPAGFKALLSN